MSARKSLVSTFLAALRKCAKTEDLEAGKRLHSDAVDAGLHRDRYVANALINMYRRCRSMVLARDVFEKMPHRNVVTWNCLILGYAENGEISVAMELFRNMDIEPDSVTFLAALKACEKGTERQFCLEKGMDIHRKAIERGVHLDVFVASSLVDMYTKCGSMWDARVVFDKMSHHNVVTWNCLILGYVEYGESWVALNLFANMNCEPNSVTFVAVLKACAGLAQVDKEHGMSIHKRAKECGCDTDVFVASTLVDMYRKYGCMRSARDVFDKMVCPSVVAWNCLIMGYVENGESLVAMDLYSNMDCAPDAFTIVAALKACSDLACENEVEREFWLGKGRQLHKQANESGFESDVYVGNTLVEMYSKCRSMSSARDAFDKMSYRNVVTWNCLILGYVENGESSEALYLFERMELEPDVVTYLSALKAVLSCGKHSLEKLHERSKERGYDSDVCVASALVELYSKYNSMHQARDAFDKMSYHNVVAWNSLILGYVENGESLVALDLFRNMDCAPNSVTYVATLKACGALTVFPFGRVLHAQICRLGYDNQVVTTALIDFYGKCGSIYTSQELFNNMHSPDTVCFSALLAGYSSCGDAYHVFDIVRDVYASGVQMNDGMFICILTVCSHAGMIEEGRKYFDAMCRYGIHPNVEHYSCMVDMLCRANRVGEALSIVYNMPFQADEVIRTSLLVNNT